MKIILDRDESLLYFVADNPRLASWLIIDLTAEELANFRECEDKFWAWQKKIEEKVYSEYRNKEVAKKKK